MEVLKEKEKMIGKLMIEGWKKVNLNNMVIEEGMMMWWKVENLKI
jgi:hypothetical protein